MNKIKHPSNRAERLKVKLKKSKPNDRLRHSRRHDVEEVKLKEADNELRKEILGIQEEG